MLSSEGLKLVFSKRRASKIWGVSEVRFKKLDSFTLETSKNHLIRNFLRNGRLRVKGVLAFMGEEYPFPAPNNFFSFRYSQTVEKEVLKNQFLSKL